MLTTLRAVVQGDRIQWLEASEQAFPAAQPIAALITPLPEQPHLVSDEQRAERRLSALKKLAALNAFSGISDPTEWQREARTDRELPGRATEC